MARWSTPRAGAVLALTAILLLALAAPTVAADESARYLAHDATAAVTADVDADGAREVVLLLDGSGGRVRLLQVWDVEDGLWRSAATSAVSRPADGGDLAVLDPADEAISLLAWRDGEVERALVVAGGDAGDYAGGCCLRVGLVELEGPGVGIRWLEAPAPRVEQVAVLDANADGADELLVVEPPDGAGERSVHLLGWRDGGFAGERVSLGQDDGTGRSLQVGETDGVAGDEVVFAADGGRSLLRIGLDETDRLLVERGLVGDAPELHLWTWGAGAGSVVLQVGTELRVVRWPRGGEPTTRAQAFRPDYPQVAVLGDGPHTVLLDRGVVGFDPRNAPSIQVLDLDLERLEVVRPTAAVDRLWELANVAMPALRGQLDSLQPYVGRFPGRLGGGEQAYISAGNLVTLDQRGRLEVRPISSLTGLAPVGVAGPGGAWWVLDEGRAERPDWALLVVDSASPRTVSVVPEGEVLEPDDPEPLAVELDGAVLAGRRLVVGDGGFEATVAGSPGSLVLGVVDQWVVHEGVLPDEPVALHLESRRRGARDQPIQAAVVRIDPAGRVSAVAWEGEVRREPPTLEAAAETVAFEPRARLTGTASADATLTVEGRSVDVAADGRFEVEVDAPIWSRDVVVVASDPVGNRTSQRVEVVGIVDYRGLPWVAILALATVAAGVVLFLRTPRIGSTARPVDDARLEELDAEPDGPDGASPAGRPAAER